MDVYFIFNRYSTQLYVCECVCFIIKNQRYFRDGCQFSHIKLLSCNRICEIQKYQLFQSLFCSLTFSVWKHDTSYVSLIGKWRPANWKDSSREDVESRDHDSRPRALVLMHSIINSIRKIVYRHYVTRTRIKLIALWYTGQRSSALISRPFFDVGKDAFFNFLFQCSFLTV